MRFQQVEVTFRPSKRLSFSANGGKAEAADREERHNKSPAHTHPPAQRKQTAAELPGCTRCPQLPPLASSGMAAPAAPVIARESCAKLSVADFYAKYMLPNRPVLIDISALTARWRVRTEWTTDGPPQQQGQGQGQGSGDGDHAAAKKQRPSAARRLDAAHLRAVCGAEEITVHNCAPQARRVMGRLKTSQMTLAEYIGWWDAHHGRLANGAEGAAAAGEAPREALAAQGDRLARLAPAAAGAAAAAAASPPAEDTAAVEMPAARPEPESADSSMLYYLKDWNYCKAHEHECQLYTRPPYFAEDWLNDHEAQQASDHRFVYLGPAGTFTPLHKDVLNSFSWSVNITGKKRWWMLPPETEPALMSTRTGAQLFDLRDPTSGGLTLHLK